MKRNKSKIAIRTVCAVLAAVILLAVSYLLYVVFSYYRVEDNLSLDIADKTGDIVPTNQELSLITYNIGFGAYNDDYSFFMDGGTHSRALSKQAVVDNTNGAVTAVLKENPDFILFQEVDVKGTRSYAVNQTQLIADAIPDFDSVFAQNYDSPYFLYPFNEPIGANRSGIMTFSRFNISASTRKSLPIEQSLYKYLDLDRAYSVSTIDVENGKKLVLYNVHLSAYTSDGSIADEQLKLLCKDMAAEYSKGNYVIAAGDFNKDMLGDSSKYFKRTEGEFTWAKAFDNTLLPDEITSYSGSNAPSCRNADSAYRGDGTDFVLSVDGILASDNVEFKECNTLDLQFAYSDHNPVKFEFILKSK